MDAVCRRRSSASAGHERIAATTRQGEQLDRQHRRNGAVSRPRSGRAPRMEASLQPCFVAATSTSPAPSSDPQSAESRLAAPALLEPRARRVRTTGRLLTRRRRYGIHSHRHRQRRPAARPQRDTTRRLHTRRAIRTITRHRLGRPIHPVARASSSRRRPGLTDARSQVDPGTSADARRAPPRRLSTARGHGVRTRPRTPGEAEVCRADLRLEPRPVIGDNSIRAVGSRIPRVSCLCVAMDCCPFMAVELSKRLGQPMRNHRPCEHRTITAAGPRRRAVPDGERDRGRLAACREGEFESRGAASGRLGGALPG